MEYVSFNLGLFWRNQIRLSDGMLIKIISIKDEATGEELKLKENHEDIFIRILFPKDRYKAQIDK